MDSKKSGFVKMGEFVPEMSGSAAAILLDVRLDSP
jgi:hypothetical protein